MKNILLSFSLIALLFSGCGGGDTATIPNPSAQDIAIKKIANYAKNSTNAKPTLQDYIDAGVGGVDASKLDKVNETVKGLTYDKVDTKQEIQELIETVGVTLPNKAPVATAQTITMLEDTSKAIALSATDLNGDALTYTVITPPTHGTFTNGVYTPTANYHGSDSFSFTANDGTLTSTPATVSITITDVADVNTAPVATAQSVTLVKDTTKTITLAGTDAESDTLTFTVVTPPAHGTFVGTTYTPTPNYNGSDSFSFTANDGSLTSAPATITITITDVNTAPVATAQSVTLDEDTTKTITLLGTDADGDTLTYTLTTNPTHGTFTNGVYTPTPNYHGSDSFSFTANDGSLTSAPATVSITIKDVAENQAPTVSLEISETLRVGSPVTITANATDSDGQIASYEFSGDMIGNSKSITKTFTTAGQKSVTVTITDNDGATATDTSTIIISEATLSKVKRTGQLYSYDEDGNIVTDGSIKDDGYYQEGLDRSYIRDDIKEVVIDTTTGLTWQDNEDAKTVKKPWITQANYDAGNRDDTSGDTATTYCSDLVLGGYGNWKVPTMKELLTIINYQPNDGLSINESFKNVSNSYYLSSNDAGGSNIWMINSNGGSSGDSYKDNYRSIRCVRSDNNITISSNFSKNGNIVKDSSTGLQWQDNTDAGINGSQKNWLEAIEYCEALSLDGKNGWRLPNINELLTLVDYTKREPFMDTDTFENVASHPYWSSTSYGYEQLAFYVQMKFGFHGSGGKGMYHFVRCVRTGE